MALHRLASVTIGVPNTAETADYYTEFGLQPDDERWFATQDGGRQLRLVHTPMRRLVEVEIGVDSTDDLAAAVSRLTHLGIESRSTTTELTAVESVTGTRAVLRVQPRTIQPVVAATPYNGPGRVERVGSRAPGVLRADRVRPRRLGHAVLGTTDFATTAAFFRDGLGFKTSDLIGDIGVFLRCSTEHHNTLTLAAPVRRR
jgi:catechol 2,3-dioxygenase-like lactoylglutathione lyase family enzyme